MPENENPHFLYFTDLVGKKVVGADGTALGTARRPGRGERASPTRRSSRWSVRLDEGDLAGALDLGGVGERHRRAHRRRPVRPDPPEAPGRRPAPPRPGDPRPADRGHRGRQAGAGQRPPLPGDQGAAAGRPRGRGACGAWSGAWAGSGRWTGSCRCSARGAATSTRTPSSPGSWSSPSRARRGASGSR